jgi:hypothetical protein
MQVAPCVEFRKHGSGSIYVFFLVGLACPLAIAAAVFQHGSNSGPAGTPSANGIHLKIGLLVQRMQEVQWIS